MVQINGKKRGLLICENNINDILSEDGKMSPKHMLTTTIGDEINESEHRLLRTKFRI